MIGYRISRARLETLIETAKPNWLTRAAERTQGFREEGRYEESSSIWGEVKSVYMTLQGSKCVYCERKLESVDFGRGEQDVEHFRPKGRVRPWPVSQSLVAEGIDVADVPDDDRGYYLLPYHPFNYVASCKPCNSALKSDYFPIAGAYELAGDDPAELLGERPYLVYPIGDFDADPERLIRFHGVSPQAIAESGHDRSRALVTIEFFKLDDEAKRKNLIRDRALVLVALYPQLVLLTDGAAGATAVAAQQVVDEFTSANAPHTNCARSFLRLFERNRGEAEEIFERICALLASIS